MPREIYKYHILHGNTTHLIPGGADILCAQEQNGIPSIWASVDPDVTAEPRTFSIIGTGFFIPENGDYIGTVQIDGFVWHVFEVPTPVQHFKDLK